MKRGSQPIVDPKMVQVLLKDPTLDFQNIAERVGVCRERVRQIALRFGVTGRKRQLPLRNSRFMAALKAKQAEEAAIFNRWKETGECDGVYSAQVINRWLSSVGMRRCCQCNLPKDLIEMGNVGNGNRGHRCKACVAANSLAYYYRMKAEHPMVWRRSVTLNNQRQAERLRRTI